MQQLNSIAVISDIHGNSRALQAVLADIQAQGITRIVNLGDTFYGPLDPGGTWDILRTMEIPTILGNQDRILLETTPEWEAIPVFGATREAIGKDGLDWIASLPATLRMDNVFLCHGTPRNDMAYLLEDVTTGRPLPRTCESVTADLLPEAEGCSLVLAGHSHFPGQMTCGDTLVVNPGSVGLPAYDDDTPPHVMAAGSPHARYAVLAPAYDVWQVEFRRVKYDWHWAATLASANGRDSWSKWLLTGLG